MTSTVLSHRGSCHRVLRTEKKMVQRQKIKEKTASKRTEITAKHPAIPVKWVSVTKRVYLTVKQKKRTNNNALCHHVMAEWGLT